MTVFQGQKMRDARTGAGLSQQELADRAGVLRETVLRAEKGQNVPGGEALARLARALDMPIDSLFAPGEADS